MEKVQILNSNKKNYVKKEVDNFFFKLREYGIYAFQTENKAKREFLINNKVPFITTLKSKKKSFVDNTTLVDEGYVINFYNLDKKQAKILKEVTKDVFYNLFFYKFKSADSRLEEHDPTKFTGTIELKNFR